MADNFVTSEFLIKLLDEKGCNLGEAMASLSIAVATLAVSSSIPKDRLLSGMDISYDEILKMAMHKSEGEKCH